MCLQLESLACICYINFYAKIHLYELVPQVMENLKFVIDLMLKVNGKVLFFFSFSPISENILSFFSL